MKNKGKIYKGIRSDIVTQPTNLPGKYENIRFNAPFYTDKIIQQVFSSLSKLYSNGERCVNRIITFELPKMKTLLEQK